MSEKSWVHELVPRLGKEIKRFDSAEIQIAISDGSKLAYSCVIHEYDKDGKTHPISAKYETDLLICDTFADGRWIPRVVVECKIGGNVTTHDALTYSSKARNTQAGSSLPSIWISCWRTSAQRYSCAFGETRRTF